MQPRIFEPFISTRDEGMGLGLSIGKTIVGKHGGQRSAANGRHGATVSFVLPVAPTVVEVAQPATL